MTLWMQPWLTPLWIKCAELYGAYTAVHTALCIIPIFFKGLQGSMLEMSRLKPKCLFCSKSNEQDCCW